MSIFKRHFFVCTTTRPPMTKPSCGQHQSQDIYIKLIEAMQQRDLYGTVAVTATGCLGSCSNGPLIVVYPEGTWYSRVTLEDIPEIVESHMQNGIPVERLIYDWADKLQG